MLLAVARRHVGHGLEAERLDRREYVVEEVVLELLRLLVAGHRIAHIAEIGVGEHDAVLRAEIGDGLDRHRFAGRRHVELLDQLRLEHVQQVVVVHLVGGVEQETACAAAHLDAELIVQEIENGLAAPEMCAHLLRDGEQQMAFGDAARFLRHRERHDVAVVVDGDRRQLEHGVDALDHRTVAFAALDADRLEELLHGSDLGVRDAVHGDVGHRVLVGVIDPATFEQRTGKIRTQLGADRRRDAQDAAGFDELFGTADRVMIHDAGRRQTCIPRAVDGLGRRVRRKGIEGVDVVVHILATRRLRNVAAIDQLADGGQRGEALRFGCCVELLDQRTELFFGHVFS